MNKNNLSLRGNEQATGHARIDMELYFDAVQNLYCPETNPNGAFPLNVAENHLMSGSIKKELADITSNKTIPDWILNYTDTLGNPEVRETISRFMENYLCKCPIHPDSIGFAAGASAIIEISSFVLANKGDVVVIPSPSYPMYSNDMGVKSGIERYDLQTHFHIEEIGSSAPVSITILEDVKKEIETEGKQFKILLITSPDNPTGCMYGEGQLRELANWCMKNGVHLIVNEIYAFSQIDTKDELIREDYNEEVSFYSFANIMKDLNSNFLHLWYGLSKDFAMSGLRFGIVHSLNGDFINALRNVNIPHMVSNHTQWMIGELFKRDHFLKEYIPENKKKLTASYKEVVKTLKNIGIPYVPARGSLFIWVDLSKYLKENTDKGQEDLWISVYENTGVLLTPGQGFGHQKKGLFRIVHSAIQVAHLTEAMKKLEKYLLTVHSIN